MIDRFLGDAFGVLSCQFWSIVLQSGARFLTGGVFECDISHRRFVAVLCMLYKIRCDPVHRLYGALPGPYVPARVSTSVHLCTATLQNLAVQQDFYSLLGVPLERSC